MQCRAGTSELRGSAREYVASLAQKAYATHLRVRVGAYRGRRGSVSDALCRRAASGLLSPGVFVASAQQPALAVGCGSVQMTRVPVSDIGIAPFCAVARTCITPLTCDDESAERVPRRLVVSPFRADA